MSKSEAESRPDVVWQINGDGVRPKAAPWGFVAQNPFTRAVPPRGKVQINLGVSASVPMLAWARGDQADYVTVPLFVPAGREVVVTVENRSEHVALTIDSLESLVNLHPLIFRGTAEVG